MMSTTGTSIQNYLKWVENELNKKDYGTVSISFKICNGQVVDVEKSSVDREHFQLEKDK